MSGEVDDAEERTGDWAAWLRGVQLAMRLEGLDEVTVEHVINRLIYGDPLGPRARHRVAEGEQIVSIQVTSPPTPAEHLLAAGLAAYSQRMHEINQR